MGCLVWIAGVRLRGVLIVSATEANVLSFDPASATGYSLGRRALLLPGQDPLSYRWVSDTQRMLAEGIWRVHRIDYENAPLSRPNDLPSPYRWCLAAIAWIDHPLSDRPLGVSVERAALVLDPLLQLVLLVGLCATLVRWSGWRSAALACLAAVFLFPLSLAFVPGAPSSLSLEVLLIVGSVLPFACFLGETRASEPSSRLDSIQMPFVVAGVAGGVGLWLNPIPYGGILLGLGAGGLVAATLSRRHGFAPALCPSAWRAWALSGTAVAFIGYLVDRQASDSTWNFATIHPLHGIAWMCLGELGAQLAIMQSEPASSSGNVTRNGKVIVYFIGLTVILIALWFGPHSSGADIGLFRLAGSSAAPFAPNLVAWVKRDGLNMELALTCLPVIGLAAALGVAGLRAGTSWQARVFPVVGALLASLILAFVTIRRWAWVDAVALCFAASLMAEWNGLSPRTKRGIFLFLALLTLSGLGRTWPRASGTGGYPTATTEAVSLVERHLAHWLSAMAEGIDTIILAPPFSTARLSYYGGLKGVGSPSSANLEGTRAVAQIVSAVTPDEARLRLEQRQITHIILPSWDQDFQGFVKGTLAKPEDSFLSALERWAHPTWLRPLVYTLPALDGLEPESVMILEVTDDAPTWLALSRQADFFLEMGWSDLAHAAGQALAQFPSQPAALAARVQIQKALGDPAATSASLAHLRAIVSADPEIELPWDRRVSVAIALAVGGESKLAQEQVRRCVAELTEPRVRLLAPGALYRLMFLAKNDRLEFPNAHARAYALEFLTPEQRRGLE